MWLLITFMCVFAFTLLKFIKIWNYWKNKGIPYVSLADCFYNYAENMFRRNIHDKKLERIYAKYPNSRYVGGYQFFQPVLFVRDLELVKQITVKDFNNFTDHNTFVTLDVDRFWSKNIFVMTDGWNQTRSSLSPLFTPNKLRSMLKLVDECANKLLTHLKTREGSVVDVFDVMSRTSTDIFGRVMFGVTCNSHIDKNNEFYLMIHKIAALKHITGFAFWSSYFCPILMKILGLKIFNKKMVYFFKTLISDTVKLRTEKNIIFPDLVQFLMEMSGYSVQNQDQNQKIKITEEDMISHALIFCFAGFDTITYAFASLCFELSLHLDVQNKVYNEIEEIAQHYNGEFTYDTLQSMKYLNAVILENLRCNMPAAIIDRKCIKPYLIEPVKPNEKPLLLDKGTWIWILHCGIHRDSNYYSNAGKFYPERFMEENKQELVPFSFLPFGSGPRKCIAFRLAILEMKCLIVHILRKYEIVIPKNTNQETKRDGVNLEFKLRY